MNTLLSPIQSVFCCIVHLYFCILGKKSAVLHPQTPPCKTPSQWLLPSLTLLVLRQRVKSKGSSKSQRCYFRFHVYLYTERCCIHSLWYCVTTIPKKVLSLSLPLADWKAGLDQVSSSKCTVGFHSTIVLWFKCKSLFFLQILMTSHQTRRLAVSLENSLQVVLNIHTFGLLCEKKYKYCGKSARKK